MAPNQLRTQVGTRSDREDRDVGVATGESSHVLGVVRDDDAPAEANRGRHNERVDRHLTTDASTSKEMPCDPGHPRSSSDHLSDTPGQNRVDCLVAATPSVQLYQHNRRNADGIVARMGTAHCRPNPVVALRY